MSENTMDQNGSANGRVSGIFVSQEAVLLAMRLSRLAVGELLPWGEVESIVGRDRGKTYGITRTAKQRVLNEHKILCITDKGEGIRRIQNEQINEAAGDALKQIGRKARRMRKQILVASSAPDFDTQSRSRAMGMMAMCGALEQATRPTTVNRVLEQAKAKNGEMNIGDTLRAFAGGSGGKKKDGGDES